MRDEDEGKLERIHHGLQLAKWARQRRAALHLTQEQVAERMGLEVDTGWVTQLENGQKKTMVLQPWLGLLAKALPKSHQCDHPRPRVVFWKLEPAVREAFARDIAGRFDLADVTAFAEQRAGGTEVEVARRAIEKKRAAANDRLKRAEALYLGGKRDAVWLATEEERLGSTLSAIDDEVGALPAPVNHDALRAASMMLESLEDQIPIISGNDLRLAIELIAVIVVGEAGASLRYADEIAPFLGMPAVVPFIDGVAPHWVANGGRPKTVPD